MADDQQYEFTSVRAIRGTESRTIAKWQQDGWELDGQSQGSLLRTELTFCRVKPETLGTRVLAAFRRLTPRARLGLAGVAGGVVLLVVALAVVLGLRGGGSASETAASETAASASRTAVAPSAQASDAAPQVIEETEPAVVPPQPLAEQVLTAGNSADLAALLAVSDPGGQTVVDFATRYRGQLIEFDGNVASMLDHGDYDTRFDILVSAGDYSTTTAIGPNFLLRDVNTTSDLHWEGPDIPATIGAGTNVHVVARVLDYNSTQQLLFLDPVSTRAR
ncbi:DUF4839 domain-containing protein [Geodermatophilus sp. SYSU D01180]